MITSIKSMTRSRTLGMLLLALIILMLAACASAPKPIMVNIQVSAASDVNPDRQGRPSPVVLHIYELSTEAQFNRLDYRSLTRDGGSALGTDLVSKDQVVLQPGEDRSIAYEIKADAAFMGFLAGYQDNDNSTWRTSVSVTPKETTAVSVTLAQQAVSASSAN